MNHLQITKILNIFVIGYLKSQYSHGTILLISITIVAAIWIIRKKQKTQEYLRTTQR